MGLTIEERLSLITYYITSYYRRCYGTGSETCVITKVVYELLTKEDVPFTTLLVGDCEIITRLTNKDQCTLNLWESEGSFFLSVFHFV